MAEYLDTEWCFAIEAWIMSPMTNKNSTGDNMQPFLTPLPTTKGAGRVPLCSARHLAPWHYFVRYSPSFQCHPEDLSIHTVKGLFKVYKNQMQIGTVFSTLLDGQRKKIQVWSLPGHDLWWNKDGLLSDPIWPWGWFWRLRARHIFVANYRKSLDYPFLEFSQWYPFTTFCSWQWS